ncbi:efflux RND transporter periplasmic adaptor subunit [Parashewanella curva]|uniref:Efflux RND transporter periplasmic adaptor subunit n=1 Tax=Parashewanella curva TaxID=2338552 RepID=A0A3L8PVM4_9GAMM|nr:efflux RND transporter periplasmic adaptor subunit [Parashewanella curva]RLV59391.1 efflux RND transporter periplasmic adaptor subunit [Parashewanella curva]
MIKPKLNSVTIAVVLALVAVAWIATGTISTSQDSSEQAQTHQQQQKKQSLFKVQVADFTANEMSNILNLRGQIEAPKQVSLKAEVSGKVIKKNILKGEQAQKGQVIIQLEENARKLSLESAKADLLVKQADLQASERLFKKKLVSSNQHKQAQAQLANAEANVKQLQLNLQHTQIKAPFSGILNELTAEPGSYVGVGDPIGTLVDNSYLLIVAQVPQRDIANIKQGLPVTAELTNGSMVQGKVSYISQSADPQTRTYRVEAKVTGLQSLPAFGQSAKVALDLNSINTHKIPASMLDLSTDGRLQVKGVNEHNQVNTYLVDLIRSDLSGVYVTGLPEQVTLITVGQGFVANGQTVEPQYVTLEKE